MPQSHDIFHNKSPLDAKENMFIWTGQWRSYDVVTSVRNDTVFEETVKPNEFVHKQRQLPLIESLESPEYLHKFSLILMMCEQV